MGGERHTHEATLNRPPPQSLGMKRTHDDGSDDDNAANVTKKAARVDSGEDEEEESVVVDDFKAYSVWDEATDDASRALVEKKLTTHDGGIIISSLFPCADCAKWTPHLYVIVDGDDRFHWTVTYDKTHWPDEAPRLSPRSVECILCGAVWNHHVNFKGMPTKRWQLLRLEWVRKSTPEQEAGEIKKEEEEEGGGALVPVKANV